MSPTVLASWYFRSQTDPEKIYRTIKIDDLPFTLSCDCPGWTRRVQPDGSRMCVHTRLVLGGGWSKDPMFIWASIPLGQDPYPTQEFTTTPRTSASQAQRAGFACTSFDDMPPRWVDYFKLLGPCLKCGYFHFPEFRYCYESQIFAEKTKAKAKQQPKAKSLTTAPKRKFSFED